MSSLADRFRRWYEYERDCNAKSLAMLSSVPDESRGSAELQKALDRMAHMLAARRLWLYRLGFLPESPRLHPKGTSMSDLPALVAETENAWTAYLKGVDDQALSRVLEWETPDGRRYRWTIEDVLTQLFGHAWYHRGQIAQLVAGLGGKAVDTDYIIWCGVNPVQPR